MKKLIKTILARTGVGRSTFFGRYPYMFTPLQLNALIKLAEETKDLQGSYVEVGCAYGATTVLMMKLFHELKIDRKGYAIDTFSGFVSSHANHDINELGMSVSIKKHFINNDTAWMQASLAASQINGVDVIKKDATKFDYDKCGKIAFSLIDVDLFEPVYDVLPKIYSKLCHGGVIVVDDCAPSDKWQGALVAYKKFTAEIGVPQEILSGKLGVIRKK